MKLRFRVIRAALLCTTVLGAPGLAYADAGSIAQAAITVASAAAFFVPVVGPFLAAAIQIGGAILIKELFNQSTVSQNKARTREFQTHPPFRFVFGAVPIEGTVVFHHSVDKYYYVAYLLNSIPIDSITRVIIQEHTDLQVIEELGDSIYDMQTVEPNPTVNGYWDDGDFYLWVGRGDQTQPPQRWLDEIGPSGFLSQVIRPSDNFKGQAVAWVRYSAGHPYGQAGRFAYGKPPPLRFEGKWSKLYDPRKDSTSGVTGASGAHRIDDPTTWEWSSNPSLCALMLATHPLALGYDTELIPIEQVAEAADDCDAAFSDSATTTAGSDFTFTAGTDNAPSLVDGSEAHIDWGRRLIYVTDGALGGESTTILVYDIDTQAYTKTIDLTAVTLKGSMYVSGIDPETGYLFGHESPSGDPDWYHAVLDPVAETMVTEFDEGNTANRFNPGRWPPIVLKNASTGVKRAIYYAGFNPDFWVGTFPGMVYQSTLAIPTDETWTTGRLFAYSATGAASKAYMLFENATKQGLYEYSIDGSGNISHTLLGTIDSTSVGNSSNFAQHLDELRLYYDRPTNSLHWNAKKSDFTYWRVGWSIATASILYTAASESTGDELRMLEQQSTLNGGIFVEKNDSGGTLYIIDLQANTVDTAAVPAPSLVGAVDFSFWDSATNCLYTLDTSNAASGFLRLDKRCAQPSTGDGEFWGCNGVVVINERELSLLDPVLDTMAGHLDTTDGLLGWRAGVWHAPVATLVQPNSGEFSVKGARDAGFDTVRASFISAKNEWEETDGPGYQLRAGSRVHSLDLPLIAAPEHAAKLEKLFALRAEPLHTCEGDWDATQMNLRIGDRVNFSLFGADRTNSTYMVVGKAPALEADEDRTVRVSVKLTLEEDLEANYTFAASDYTPQDPATPTTQPVSAFGPPSSVVAVQSDYAAADGSAVARLKVTVTITDGVSGAASAIEIEVDDGGGFAALTTLSVVEGTLTYVAHLEPALAGVSYTPRARTARLLEGTEMSDWVVGNTVTIVAPVLDYSTADYSGEYS